MSSNIPSGRVQSLQWLEANIDVWNTNQAAIGLTSAQVIDLTLDIVNTRDAFSSVEEIRAESKSTTQTFYAKSDALSLNASAAISSIKAFAKNSDDPAAVYQAANITGKAPPSPVAPPETPVIETLSLNSLGNVTLTWTGRGPVGTNYIVSRKLNAATEWTNIGETGGKEKVFLDTTVPDGTDIAAYTVKAIRGSDQSAPSVQAAIDLKGTAAAGGAAEAA